MRSFWKSFSLEQHASRIFLATDRWACMTAVVSWACFNSVLILFRRRRHRSRSGRIAWPFNWLWTSKICRVEPESFNESVIKSQQGHVPWNRRFGCLPAWVWSGLFSLNLPCISLGSKTSASSTLENTDRHKTQSIEWGIDVSTNR